MKQPLTQRQASILAFLKKYQREQGYPPTVREIAQNFRIATPRGAKKHLDRLQDKGYIQKRPGSPRAIEVLEPLESQGAVYLPILGRVRAGPLNLASQEVLGQLAVDPGLTRDPGAFVLQVRGDSMVEDGVLPGDYAIVKPQNQAANGEMVVAQVGDEATVKRFFKKKEGVWLQPANARHRPISINARSEEFRIIGKVVGIVRKL